MAQHRIAQPLLNLSSMGARTAARLLLLLLLSGAVVRVRLGASALKQLALLVVVRRIGTRALRIAAAARHGRRSLALRWRLLCLVRLLRGGRLRGLRVGVRGVLRGARVASLLCVLRLGSLSCLRGLHALQGVRSV